MKGLIYAQVRSAVHASYMHVHTTSTRAHPTLPAGPAHPPPHLTFLARDRLCVCSRCCGSCDRHTPSTARRQRRRPALAQPVVCAQKEKFFWPPALRPSPCATTALPRLARGDGGAKWQIISEGHFSVLLGCVRRIRLGSHKMPWPSRDPPSLSRDQTTPGGPVANSSCALVTAWASCSRL